VSYRTLAVYPLLKGAQLFGALAIYSQKLESYSPDHLHSLERVAALTSDAIHNALVHAETRRRAATDALTGLPNARALEACIERELGRESGRDAGTGEAAGEAQGRKLLLIDLNDFRAVNAALGHEQGDELLKEVGRVIQAQLRQGDYLFRYAGDEFVALLDGVAREQLAEVALRIESAVAALAAPGLAAGGCRLSVSMGQAEVGRDGAALEEVLEAAERRLQADKAARRSLAQLSASPAR
jgi:two-component system, cell cycle response regulator